MNPYALPAELTSFKDVAKAQRSYARLSAEHAASMRRVDELRRMLPRVEADDTERLAQALVAEKAEPKPKADGVRRQIEDADRRYAASQRALALARDELSEAISKRRDGALPRLRERRERSRARVREAIDSLEQAVASFDEAYCVEVELHHHPQPWHPLVWGRFIPKIRRPSGEPVEFSEALAALRDRFGSVPEPDGDFPAVPMIAVDALEEAFEDEPDLDLEPSRLRTARNGIRV